MRPERDQFYFPTGIALDATGEVMFVANANADLRFDSGSMTPVDLATVDAVFANWRTNRDPAAGAACEVDQLFPFTLNCDEAEFILADGTVRIGNFATDVQVQALATGNQRLFVAVRGDPSLTWVDYDVPSRSLACGGEGDYPRCDSDHRLLRLREDRELPPLQDEPFQVYVDSTNGYVMVTHLTQAVVTLADAPTDGAPPVLTDNLGGLFQTQPVTGIRGAVGIAGRTPGAASDIVYVTSRAESRVQTLTVTRAGQFPRLVVGDSFFLNRVQPSDDARGIAFNAAGTRAFVVNRNPPVLHIVDTSMGPDGTPKNEFLGGVELCSQASNVVVADVGRGERAYVGCFQDGQIWTIDPGSAAVEAITNVGRGPHGLVIAPTRQKLFVSNFLEDTIAVIDLEPGSDLENQVVLKLGRPRQTENP